MSIDQDAIILQLQTLTQTMSELQGRVQALSIQNAALITENQNLRSQAPSSISTIDLSTQLSELVSQLRVVNETPTSSITPPQPSTQKSERHPDPQTFNGDKKDLPRFLSQLNNKLRMNADRYPTEEQRVGYAFSRLEGPAVVAMEGFWSSGACLIHSLIDFTEHLERLYGNPYRKEQAVNEWMLLR